MMRTGVVVLLMVCCVGVVLQGAGYAFLWRTNPENTFAGYTDRLEELSADAVAFAKEHIVSDVAGHKKKKWTSWFNAWNEELLKLKKGMRSISGEHPLIYDYFCVVLRNVHLVYEEYELLYFGEKSSFDSVRVHQQHVQESFVDLRKEIKFIMDKEQHGASQDFYQ